MKKALYVALALTMSSAGAAPAQQIVPNVPGWVYDALREQAKRTCVKFWAPGRGWLHVNCGSSARPSGQAGYLCPPELVTVRDHRPGREGYWCERRSAAARPQASRVARTFEDVRCPRGQTQVRDHRTGRAFCRQ